MDDLETAAENGWDAHRLGLILDDVNTIRLALAIGEGTLEALPPGKQQNSEQCVLARALSNGWKAEIDERIVLTPPDDVEVDLSACVRELNACGIKARKRDDDFDECSWVEIEIASLWADFIDDFDDGAIPHLIFKDN